MLAGNFPEILKSFVYTTEWLQTQRFKYPTPIPCKMFRKISGKKAASAVMVIIIIVVAIFLYWLVTGTMQKKECKKDSECGEGYYCGSDFACHEFKVVEKNVIEYNLLVPSIILGFAIIIAAIILRWKSGKAGFG
jgi:hypothetical protein